MQTTFSTEGNAIYFNVFWTLSSYKVGVVDFLGTHLIEM